MLGVLGYFIGGFIDVLAYLVFMFVLFRFSIGIYLSYLFFVSASLTVASFIIRDVYFLREYSPILNCLLIIISLIILFRVKWFYAITMVAVSYSLFMVIQMTHVFIVQKYITPIDLTTLDDFGWFMRVNQLLSDIIIYLISYLLHRYKLYFSFIPVDSRDRFVFNRLHLVMIIIVFVALVVIAFMLHIKDALYIVLALAAVTYYSIANAIKLDREYYKI